MPRIFVANSGRCGSLFLSQIFGLLTPIPSFHEPIPYCTGDVLREVNEFKPLSDASKNVLATKVEEIQRNSEDGNYLESSQMFIKCYVETVLDTFDDIYCIYLYRNPIEVVLSYYNKCRDHQDEWFLKSHWDANVLKTAEPLDYYDNILWNCYEVRERYLLYKHRFAKTWEFDFKDINDLQEWKRMFKYFGISIGDVVKLPDAKRNAISEDRGKTIKALIKDWDKGGKDEKT